ncbi:hypothetical protein ABVT39_009350 [Epinephelus coioides]
MPGRGTIYSRSTQLARNENKVTKAVSPSDEVWMKKTPPPQNTDKVSRVGSFWLSQNDQGVIVDDGFPVCNTCRKKVAAKGSNTSNMIHLRDNHLALHAQVKVKNDHVVPICVINLLITDLIQLCWMIAEVTRPEHSKTIDTFTYSHDVHHPGKVYPVCVALLLCLNILFL